MRALNDVPLIRELQRMVTSNPGPINWEIAQQIARAVAGAGKLTHAPTKSDIDDFTEDCRIAELQIAARTGSDPSHSITETSVLDRKAWADLNLDILRPLLEKLALHLGQQLTAAPIPQFQSALGALTPFFFGIQVGFLIGYLSRRVLGQSELMLPSSERAPARFVLPNITQAQADLELDAQQFRLWLAMKEVAHRLRYQDVPWGAPYLDSLVTSYIEGGSIDANELRNRIQSLGDAEEISAVLERPEELIPLLATPEQEQTLSRIQVFLSLIEGHV
ncbi:MAG TPA: zinc-dependent metalloprotease, partial [Actinomycetota bacterium]|nr:zinc-dependent metalloprotease [Actinomycetota bacterium]